MQNLYDTPFLMLSTTASLAETIEVVNNIVGFLNKQNFPEINR
jgi:hypothetical protein